VVGVARALWVAHAELTQQRMFPYRVVFNVALHPYYCGEARVL